MSKANEDFTDEQLITQAFNNIDMPVRTFLGFGNKEPSKEEMKKRIELLDGFLKEPNQPKMRKILYNFGRITYGRAIRTLSAFEDKLNKAKQTLKGLDGSEILETSFMLRESALKVLYEINNLQKSGKDLEEVNYYKFLNLEPKDNPSPEEIQNIKEKLKLYSDNLAKVQAELLLAYPKSHEKIENLSKKLEEANKYLSDDNLRQVYTAALKSRLSAPEAKEVAEAFFNKSADEKEKYLAELQSKPSAPNTAEEMQVFNEMQQLIGKDFKELNYLQCLGLKPEDNPSPQAIKDKLKLYNDNLENAGKKFLKDYKDQSVLIKDLNKKLVGANKYLSDDKLRQVYTAALKSGLSAPEAKEVAEAFLYKSPDNKEKYLAELQSKLFIQETPETKVYNEINNLFKDLNQSKEDLQKVNYYKFLNLEPKDNPSPEEIKNIKEKLELYSDNLAKVQAELLLAYPSNEKVIKSLGRKLEGANKYLSDDKLRQVYTAALKSGLSAPKAKEVAEAFFNKSADKKEKYLAELQSKPSAPETAEEMQVFNEMQQLIGKDFKELNYLQCLGLKPEDNPSPQAIKDKLKLYNDNLENAGKKFLKVYKNQSVLIEGLKSELEGANKYLSNDKEIQVYTAALKSGLSASKAKEVAAPSDPETAEAKKIAREAGFTEDVTPAFINFFSKNPGNISTKDIHEYIIQKAPHKKLKEGLLKIQKDNTESVETNKVFSQQKNINQNLATNIEKALKLISYYEKKEKHKSNDQSIWVYGDTLDEYNDTKTMLEKAKIIDPAFNEKYKQAQEILSDRDVKEKYKEAYNKDQNNHEVAYKSAMKYKKNKEEFIEYFMDSASEKNGYENIRDVFSLLKIKKDELSYDKIKKNFEKFNERINTGSKLYKEGIRDTHYYASLSHIEQELKQLTPIMENEKTFNLYSKLLINNPLEGKEYPSDTVKVIDMIINSTKEVSAYDLLDFRNENPNKSYTDTYISVDKMARLEGKYKERVELLDIAQKSGYIDEATHNACKTKLGNALESIQKAIGPSIKQAPAPQDGNTAPAPAVPDKANTPDASGGNTAPAPAPAPAAPEAKRSALTQVWRFITFIPRLIMKLFISKSSSPSKGGSDNKVPVPAQLAKAFPQILNNQLNKVQQRSSFSDKFTKPQETHTKMVDAQKADPQNKGILKS